MPELPEVQTVVNTLLPKLLGQRIYRIVHLRDDIVHPAGFDLRAALSGRIVKSLTRRAKRIVIELDDGNRLYIHLGMTGRLTIERTSSDIQPHTHLIADLGRAIPARRDVALSQRGRRRVTSRSAGTRPYMQLRFRDPRRFGGIWWIGIDSPDDKIGPEPLGLRSSQLAKRLARTRRAVKSALLDQSLIAGLGNIYVDEALFGAKLHPLLIANELTDEQVSRLNRAIKLTLRRALRHRGSTLRDYVDADGVAGRFQRLHRVYDRESQPCTVCRASIIRIVVGGRSTHFCPRCQKV